MDRLIQMMLNRFLRQLINKGINAGITQVSGKGNPPVEMAPEDRDHLQLARQAGRRARQAANIARKLLR